MSSRLHISLSLSSTTFVAALASNALYAFASGYYFYITFLGYNGASARALLDVGCGLVSAGSRESVAIAESDFLLSVSLPFYLHLFDRNLSRIHSPSLSFARLRSASLPARHAVLSLPRAAHRCAVRARRRTALQPHRLCRVVLLSMMHNTVGRFLCGCAWVELTQSGGKFVKSMCRGKTEHYHQTVTKRGELREKKCMLGRRCVRDACEALPDAFGLVCALANSTSGPPSPFGRICAFFQLSLRHYALTCAASSASARSSSATKRRTSANEL